MTHPIPPGTRDILPDEMRELRALQAKLAAVFERFGYGEVATPTVEYDSVLVRAATHPARRPPTGSSARTGELLAMRCRHDRADRPPRRQPLRRGRAAAALLLQRPRLPRGPPPARPDGRVLPGRGGAGRPGAPEGTVEVDRGPERGARRRRARAGRDRAGRRRALSPAPRGAGRRGGRPRARARTCLRPATWSASRRSSAGSASRSRSAIS